MDIPVSYKFIDENKDFRSIGIIVCLHNFLGVLMYMMIDSKDDAVFIIPKVIVNISLIFLGLKLTKVELSKELFKPKLPIKSFLNEALLMKGFSSIAGVVFVIVSTLFYLLTAQNFAAPSEDEASNLYLLSLVYSWILAPVIEEILFRGVILRGLAKYNKLFALVASAILFGFFHRFLFQGFHAIVLGLVFGYAALKHDSLFIPILLHMFNNISVDLTSEFGGFSTLFLVFSVIYVFIWLTKNYRNIIFKVRQAHVDYPFYSHLFFRASMILFFLLFVYRVVG